MKLICILIFCISTLSAYSQDSVFLICDTPPTYPGGYSELSEFIKGHIQYPKTALNDKIEGKVFIRFVIDATGTVKNPVVIRTLRKDCDDEALRVIKLISKWNPGIKNNKVVAVYYTIPVEFKISAPVPPK